MKTIKSILTFFIVISCVFYIQAQEGPKINPEELADKQLDALSKDIEDLDDFQRLELREFIVENTTRVKDAIGSGMNSANLQFLIQNTSTDFDNKLKEVLLPEQFEKYMELRRQKAAEGNGNVKKKKDKKDKKNKSADKDGEEK